MLLASCHKSALPQGVVFRSDWSTGTGQSNSALLDDGQRPHWENGENKYATDLNVITATGLGFPAGMSNVLRHEFLTPKWAAWLQTQETWPAPAIGETYYFRVYFRPAYPNTDPSEGNAHHPIQNTSSPNLYNWHMGNNLDGTFPLQMWWDDDGSHGTYSDSHWGPTKTAPGVALAKNVTYRLEWAITRVTTGTFTLAIRIYGADDATLLFPYADGNSKMVSDERHGSVVLNDLRAGSFTGDADILRKMELGNNGWQGFASTSYDYFGGVAICSDTWCGPYRASR